MGIDIEGVEKYRSNGVVPWYDVQVSDTYSADIRQLKSGGDGGYLEDTGGV